MKHFVFHMALAILLTSTALQAQVVDTTKLINSWKLMHNYSRFEDVALDTTTFDLHLDYDPLYRNGVFYESLGRIGNAARNLDFFERPGTDRFLFGNSLYPYLANPDRTIFYNTRKPFSEIIYSNIIGVQWNEETVRLKHTQNLDPFTNFGLDFELLSGKELYNNDESRFNDVTLFGSRAREKYSAFGTLHYNNFNNKENGGLRFPSDFIQGTATQEYQYPVNLEKALSGYRVLTLFYTQKLMLQEKTQHKDTLGNVISVTGKNIAINHQLLAERNTRFFSDMPDSALYHGYYDHFYYFQDEIKDSVVQDKITNTFQLIYGDPYTDKLSARIYAGHELTRYGQRSPDAYTYLARVDTLNTQPLELDSIVRDTARAVFGNHFFNELFVGFYLAGPPENKWYWNIDGKYYVAGYYRNNFSAHATFAHSLGAHMRLGLRGSIENRNVSYYHNHYASAFFRWDNDFKASQRMMGEAFIASDDRRFDASVKTGLLTNYIYWDEQALPAQYDNLIYLVAGKLSSHLKAGAFHTVNHLLVQYSTAQEVLNLPLVAVKTSNFLEKSFFKDALIAELGFDFMITSRYYSSAYMPPLGQFYLQKEEMTGGFPYLDVFLGIRIKRTRIFGSLNNSLSGIAGRDYFSTYSYAGKPRYFKFGLAWTFYD